MAINLKDTVQIIRGKKADIAARTGANGELNWAEDTYELYIHDGKTRGGHIIGKTSGTAGVVGGAGIAVSTSDGISTVSIKRDPSNVLYATTDGAGVRIGTSGALQITAQNALDLRVAEGGGIIVDSSGVKIDSAVLSSVFRYAGQVNSVDDLPSDAQPGDVYDVKDSGANYVWSGTSWDNLGGIMSVDAAPTQGSTNPVASGGVYDAIQDVKLYGDGTTVTVADNTITAKDIAIGGDTSDLTSARGIFNAIPTGGVDCNTLIKQGVYSVNWTGTTNGPGYSCKMFVVVPKNSGYITQLAFSITGPRLAIRGTTDGGDTWTYWTQYISVATIGDGITVNNGIISVPEYEGATADTAATSGLVPPATAGQEGYVLGGDGEWHPADSTPVGTIVWSAATAAPNGYLLCNGATVGRTTYSALFAAIGTTYGAGDGSTTFALPNLIGRVMWGGTSPGQYLAAGLPGFGGSFQAFASVAATGSGDFSQAIPSTGAQKYNIGTLASSSGGEGFTDVSINPDSIYGNSDTVQPPALTLVPYIKAFSAATNQGMIDLTSLANDIAALDAERLKQIGQIQTFVSTNLPEGWMICDGSSVLFADWPEFQQVYNEGRFTGMTLSASDPSQVGKLVLNGSSGVYLPDLEGLYEQASSAATAGGYLAAWLPNIRGTSGASDKTVDGAFYDGSTLTQVGNSTGSGNVKFFSAAQYNTIYSDSVTTVQPPSVQYVRAMYLGKPAAAA